MEHQDWKSITFNNVVETKNVNKQKKSIVIKHLIQKR